MDKYIICETAPGKMFAYQVYERQGDWTVVYYAPTKRLDNQPTTLTVARNRLTKLRNEDAREASRQGGSR